MAYNFDPELEAIIPLWMHASAAGLGIDPARIGICGQSAGGGLAAGLALMARDKHGPDVPIYAAPARATDPGTFHGSGIIPHAAVSQRYNQDVLGAVRRALKVT